MNIENTYFERDRKFLERLEEYESKWTRAFPGVDIQSEIIKADAWLDVNRNRRPRNCARFLLNWLKRCPTNRPSSSNRAEELRRLF